MRLLSKEPDIATRSCTAPGVEPLGWTPVEVFSDEFRALDIGNMSIFPPVELAPMAGVTDVPFRALCREFGAGLYVNQMITARGWLEGHAKTRKLAEFGDTEWPRSIQLYGTVPSEVGEAVRRLVDQARVDHIDMNFGCPMPKVTRHGGGAALPFRSALLRDIVSTAVNAAGSVPITIKFRMGIDDDNLTFIETGQIAEAAGCAAVALHARTAEQLYSGAARWTAIGELKEAVTTIPVLGNGDVWEPADAIAMMRQTGCDGVVVGRGCLGRPWLFAALSAAFHRGRLPELPSLGQVASMMVRHGAMLIDWYGTEDALRQFRKHAQWYLMGFPIGPELRAAFGQVSTLAELKRLCAMLAPGEPFPISVLRQPRSHTGGPRRVVLPEGWLDDHQARGPLAPDADVLVSGG